MPLLIAARRNMNDPYHLRCTAVFHHGSSIVAWLTCTCQCHCCQDSFPRLRVERGISARGHRNRKGPQTLTGSKIQRLRVELQDQRSRYAGPSAHRISGPKLSTTSRPSKSQDAEARSAETLHVFEDLQGLVSGGTVNPCSPKPANPKEL